MSRITQLAQIMAIGALSSLTVGDGDLALPLTSREGLTDAERDELVERRKAHERSRRAEAEKAQAAYDAKAQIYRDERLARKAANFAKRQPKKV